MDYTLWIRLINRTSEDKELKALLHSEGFNSVPAPERDEIGVYVQFGECTLRFLEESQFPDREDLQDGDLVLSAVTISLRDRKAKILYDGPVPYDIDINDSPTEVRNRFGTPIEEKVSERVGGYDAFLVDSLRLSVGYLKGREKIRGVTVSLPINR